MSARIADLHMHTHFSDGTQSPEELIEECHAKGLSCIAVTDHDTIAAIAPAMEAARKYGIEVLPGVELSTEMNGKDIHMLAYCFDYENEEFAARLNAMQDTRVERMIKMIAKLKGFGITDIALEEVTSLAQSKSVGRPHLAQVLVQKGHVKDLKDAFNKYLADDAPAFVPKFKQSPLEAINFIKSFGGVAVLAHPMITQVDELIPHFVKAGLGGIEAIYPNNSDNVMEFYQGLARKHNLVVTGGSDAHGAAKAYTSIAKVTIPYELVERLKQAAQYSSAHS